MGELQRMGWTVERTEVQGSRFPQQAATWIGWLLYGSFMTAAYLMTYILGFRSRVIFIEGLLALGLGQMLFVALSLNRIRWRCVWKPIERAPLVVARRATDSSAPVRIVFQGALGGLKPDCFSSLGLNRLLTMVILHWSLFATILIGFAAVLTIHQLYVRIIQCFGAGLLALTWLAILCSLGWDLRSRETRTGPAGRIVTAWPFSLHWREPGPEVGRHRSSRYSLLRAARRSNYAGSSRSDSIAPVGMAKKAIASASARCGRRRRRTRSVRSRPTFTRVPRPSQEGGGKSVDSIARRDPWSYLQFWPFEQRFRATPRVKTVEVFALLGSISAGYSDTPIEPKVLEQAWQLATEIALRWEKRQRDKSTPADASPAPDFSNERGTESA